MTFIVGKLAFCVFQNKGTCQLYNNHASYQHLSFRYIVQSLYFLNLKFQASSYLQWLYSLVCVLHGRKPHRQVFSGHCPYHITVQASTQQPAAPTKVVVPLSDETENITRWIVDQNFRRDQERLKIPFGEIER